MVALEVEAIFEGKKKPEGVANFTKFPVVVPRYPLKFKLWSSTFK